MRTNILLGLVLVTAVLSLFFYQQIAQIILVIGYAVAILLVVSAILMGFFGMWMIIERLRLVRAGRIEAEKQAQVMTVTDNGETWVRDTNPKATWRNLTGTPALYVNGQYSTPSDLELALYRYRLTMSSHHTSGSIIPGQIQALPTPDEAAPLDLLTVFTQPAQTYAVIGGQQTGKTWQARHMAAYWAKQGCRPVVIGPKWDKGEWSGCYLIGGAGNMTAVEWGITMIGKLVERRHADTNTTHKNHPIQPIFFDDWTPIVDAVANARALVLEATTLYASVNVLLYFILHSDTAAAWGVDRKGAALKDNVVKLFIVPQYDEMGLVIRSRTQGYIRFAGEAVDRQARLFTTPPPVVGQPTIIRPATWASAPTATEAQILALHQQGASHAKICEQVWGYKSSNKYPEIEGVIAKFNGR